MKPKEVRSLFYDRLAATVADGMPTRKSARSGIAWRSGVAGIYHHVLVLPYVGDFEHPERQGFRSWTTGGRPIPRIHVNHYDFCASHAQERRWSAADAPLHGPWHNSGHMLELTVGLEELADFAPWVAAWTRVVDANDPVLLPAPPHPLQCARPAELLLRTAYEWTARAADEYEQRRRRHEGA